MVGDKQVNDELYLEKLKIAERLQAVENVLISYTTESKAWREHSQKLLDDHSKEIWGSGEKDPGLKTKTDRLVQIEENRKWILRTLYATVVGLLAKTGWDGFK